MRFGVFYELQLPRPWNDGDEHRLFKDAVRQIVLADELGFDYAWEVEHHFLDEYSHSSAPEVLLAAAAGQTKTIRLGHGIKQVIPNYNHPARSAETIATLDSAIGWARGLRHRRRGDAAGARRIRHFRPHQTRPCAGGGGADL